KVMLNPIFYPWPTSHYNIPVHSLSNRCSSSRSLLGGCISTNGFKTFTSSQLKDIRSMPLTEMTVIMPCWQLTNSFIMLRPSLNTICTYSPAHGSLLGSNTIYQPERNAGNMLSPTARMTYAESLALFTSKYPSPDRKSVV